MRYTNRAAKAHVLEVAAANGVAVQWVRSWHDAEAWPDDRSVQIPVIARPRDYLVALHEIGHCLSPQSRRLGMRFDCGGELACESWAWAWAVDQARLPIPWRDWQLVGDCLAGYMRWHAEARPPAGPPPRGTLTYDLQE